MKKMLLISFMFITMAIGCTNIGSPGDSQKPIAYIDAISPLSASLGAEVSFVGHGTDPSRPIVAYRWHSSINGELSILSSFSTSSLSEGVHTIYLKVQNEKGLWSEEVTGTIEISGAVASEESSKPVIITFSANPVSITAGDSSELS